MTDQTPPDNIDPSVPADSQAPRSEASEDKPDYGDTIAGTGPTWRSPSSTPPSDDYGATLASAGRGSKWSGEGSGSGFSSGDGSLEFVRELGKGGMGVVQLARDHRLNRWVAVKRITDALAGDSSQLDRFMIEARSAAALSHFHLVQVFDIGEDAEGPFIKMEYVPGPYPPDESDSPGGLPNPPVDLEAYVKRNGPLPINQAIELCIKLCSGIGYAHRMKIIHRDIKPANILLGDDLNPKLGDFGLARQQSAEDQGLTLAGSSLLTLGYGAPEQELDASTVDHRADIYGIAATLWFAVTGQSPRHFRESETPELLREVIAKAMMKDRERRYQSIEEFTTALEVVGTRAAMSDGRTSQQAAGPATGDKLVVGNCYQCGHHHGGDADALKYCASCGASLRTPCQKCDHDNPIWSKFCGGCGVDIIRKLSQTKERFEKYKSSLPELLDQYKLDHVDDLYAEISQTVDPRLESIRIWAQEQNTQTIEPAKKQAQVLIAAARAKVQALVDSQDYQQAIDVIDSLPENLQQNLEGACLGSLGGKALAHSKRECLKIVQAIDRLVESIDYAGERDAYNVMDELADQLLMLRKDHEHGLRGKEFARCRTTEVEESGYNEAIHTVNTDLIKAFLVKYQDSSLVPPDRYNRIVGHYRRVLRRAVIGREQHNNAIREEYLAWRSDDQQRIDISRSRLILFLAVNLKLILTGYFFGIVASSFVVASMRYPRFDILAAVSIGMGSVVGIVWGVTNAKRG